MEYIGQEFLWLGHPYLLSMVSWSSRGNDLFLHWSFPFHGVKPELCCLVYSSYFFSVALGVKPNNSIHNIWLFSGPVHTQLQCAYNWNCNPSSGNLISFKNRPVVLFPAFAVTSCFSSKLNIFFSILLRQGLTKLLNLAYDHGVKSVTLLLPA